VRIKAWEVSDDEWTMVVFETTRGRARVYASHEFTDGDTDFFALSCRRAPAFDDLAAQAGKPAVVEETARYIERGMPVLCDRCETLVCPEDSYTVADDRVYCDECSKGGE
jgi:hypothetical protein